MKFTKVLSLVLCLIMVLSVLVACADGGKGDETTVGGEGTQVPGSNVEETTSNLDPNGYEKDNLPDKVFDDQFRILSWSNQKDWEYDQPTERGEPLKDIVYYRNQHLIDKYGITIAPTYENGDWDNKNTFIKVVEANMNETGENAHHAVANYFAISGAMTIKGFFEDMSDKQYAPYIDLSKPWWPDDLLGSARVNGAVYAATGDITPTFIRNLSACHVNLDIFEDYNPGVDVFDLVRNKEWTWEKVAELALNKVPEGGDQFAITMDGNVQFDDIFYGAGFTFVENLEDGSIKMRDLNTDERFLDFYEFAYRLGAENADVSFAKGTMASAFQAGKSMIQLGTFSQIQNFLLEVDFDYACVPYPMFVTETHKEQTEYHSVQGFWTTLYSVPNNCPDYELSSFTIEALASYGYREFTPVWFEQSFQTRFVQTPDNAEMLELIKNGVLFDTARIFGTHINCFSAFREAAKGNADWSSYWATNFPAWDYAIKQVNTKLG